ncbi:hypothetical protein D477_013546 [Arthrobacter crystallopoietes BAB-32]|uniref:SHOCT domain-containing protein n=1 Tax=Arthrobacter crystallopoietes BAB-32 TaxID=1246476 RepID=N1V623_9MICC|nr:SHOCT domain-containing protein [Arthrobacter crystallopoietes]EMY33693.1 hypothetical protein D477_013546 [Arthrobacter crystallopoietes BAB-32]
MMDGNWLFLGFAWIFGLVLLLVVVLLAVLVVRALISFTRNEGAQTSAAGAQPLGPPPRSRARQILDERLAHGHITPDDYNERLRVLGETPLP